MSKGNDTSTTTQEPWAELQPYLLGQDAVAPTEGYWQTTGNFGDDDYSRRWIPGTPGQEAISGLLPEAQRLYEQGASQFYPGQTYVNFDPIRS